MTGTHVQKLLVDTVYHRPTLRVHTHLEHKHSTVSVVTSLTRERLNLIQFIHVHVGLD